MSGAPALRAISTPAGKVIQFKPPEELIPESHRHAFKLAAKEITAVAVHPIEHPQDLVVAVGKVRNTKQGKVASGTVTEGGNLSFGIDERLFHERVSGATRPQAHGDDPGLDVARTHRSVHVVAASRVDLALR